MIKKYGLQGEHFGDFVILASSTAPTTDGKNWYDRGWRGTAVASYVVTPPSTWFGTMSRKGYQNAKVNVGYLLARKAPDIFQGFQEG